LGRIVGSSYISIRKIFKICKLIATLSAEMALEIPNHVLNIFATSNLTHGSIAHVTEYAQERETLKEVHVDQITPMTPEVTRFWCLLDVGEDARQEFLPAHSTLTAAVIESSAREIKRLVGLHA
jgi:hypothetical protein